MEIDMERKSWFWKFALMATVMIAVDLLILLCFRCSILNWDRTYRVPVISVSGDEYREDKNKDKDKDKENKNSSKYKQKVTVEHEENLLELDWESEDCEQLYKEGDTALITKDKRDRMKIANILPNKEASLFLFSIAMCLIFMLAMITERGNEFFMWVHSITLCSVFIVLLLIGRGNELLLLVHSLIMCLMLMVGLVTKPDSLSFWLKSLAILVLSLWFIDSIPV